MRSVLIDRIYSQNKYTVQDVLSNKGRIYTFLNPVSYLDAMKHKVLFSQFDCIFADGSLLVAAIIIMYGFRVSRRSFDMTSLASDLFEYAQKNSKTIYIVASKQEQVKKAVEIIKERYPGVMIAGYRNGYFYDDVELENEMKHIMEVSPDYLIVGMGAIKQEQFLLRAKESGFQGTGFTCGGFIHQVAEKKMDYYPTWINRWNMRFLYRIYKEPHTRMRYLKAGVVFPVIFLWERLFG